MNKKLIAVIMLTFLSCPSYSQDGPDAADGSNGAIGSIISLGERISRMIHTSFASMEALATDEFLIAAIKDDDRAKLDELSDSFKSRLNHSLKVRIYIKGKEKVDNETTPACGYACIAIIRAAYEGKPDAEALLFRSIDANITLARGVQDANGETIGAIAAHYPYSHLKDEIAKLTMDSMFTELRQRVSSAPVTLLSHGDRTIKQGTPQKIVKIPQSRWYITVWTPGGVALEAYDEPPALPWLYIILAIIVVIVGIAALIIYRIKHPTAAGPKKVKSMKTLHAEAFSAEAISYDHEHDSPTLILGGGAEDVDVSKYLKDSDITDLKDKLT